MTLGNLPGRQPASSFWGPRPVHVHSTRTHPLDSDVSTADTIGVMRHLARRYARDPIVLSATAEACSGLRTPPVAERDIACSIFRWIRANVRFVEDEALMYEQLGIAPANLDKELLIVPPALLSMPVPMGDCDDFSLLLSSQLLAAGLRPYYVTVAADRALPRKFSHIYVCARLEDENTYLCLDPGNRLLGVKPGWEISNVTRKAIWAV